MLDRLDSWAERSRLNPWRLLVMDHPQLTADVQKAFDQLIEKTPTGGEVEYDLPYPKWWFLHHAATRGFVLHGSNERNLQELGPRATGDAYGRPVTALFASDDAIWPLYFATVNRATLRHGYINWATHVRGASRYLFSIGANPNDEASWTSGTVYLLPSETFRRTRDSRELISEEAVRPRAQLSVAPSDFPFQEQTVEHHANDTPRRVVVRHALRRDRHARARHHTATPTAGREPA